MDMASLTDLDNLPSSHGDDTAEPVNDVLTYDPTLQDAPNPTGFYRGRSELEAIRKAGIRPQYTSRGRDLIAAAALPRIAAGERLADVAVDVGVTADTLSGWLLTYDEPAYREAQRAQLAGYLVDFAGHQVAAVADAEKASQMVHDKRVVVIDEGEKGTRYQLLGPELAKTADARSKIAERASRYFQWMAETRFPKAFAKGGADTGGLVRASFTFIIDGRPTSPGRTIEAQRSNNEQGPGGSEEGQPRAIGIMSNDDAPLQGDVIHSQDLADGDRDGDD